MTALTVSVVLLWAAVIVLAVLLWALSRQVGVLFERVAPMGALVTDSGPAVGTESPQFDLRGIQSEIASHLPSASDFIVPADEVEGESAHAGAVDSNPGGGLLFATDAPDQSDIELGRRHSGSSGGGGLPHASDYSQGTPFAPHASTSAFSSGAASLASKHGGAASLRARDWDQARNYLKAALAKDEQVRIYQMFATLEQEATGDRESIMSWLSKAAHAKPSPTWNCTTCGTAHAEWKAVCHECDSFAHIVWDRPMPARSALPIERLLTA